MLQAVITSEWAQSLDEDQILEHNPETGRRFIDTVDVHGLGGYALDLYHQKNSGIFLLFDAAEQQDIKVRRMVDLNLSFDHPAVIGLPNYNDFSPNKIEITPGSVAAQMDKFFRESRSVHDRVMGYEKLLLPLAGVAITEKTSHQSYLLA